MTDFITLKHLVFNELSKIDDVNLLNDEQKELQGYKEGFYFSIDTEYMYKTGSVKLIRFIMYLPDFFPLELPKIYLQKEDLEAYRILPHVEDNGFICTFDTALTRPNPKDPVAVAKECLKRAKSIIELGTREKNFKDYENEFLSYWERKYDNEPNVLGEILCLSDVLDNQKIELVKLKEKSYLFNYVLHQNENHAIEFLNYLKTTNNIFEKKSIFYLGQINIEFIPPFSLTNRKISKIVDNLPRDTQQKFKHYINSSKFPKIVAATVITNGKSKIICWEHPSFHSTKKRKGFRAGALTNYKLLTTFHSNDFVQRYSPTTFSPLTKELRTGGIASNRNFTFLIGGIGSVGSNLIYFLNSYSNVHFKLIDPELLLLENIGRHFLGYSHVGYRKVFGMKFFLTNKNPFQKVDVKAKSILTVFQENIDYFDDSDYIFLTTGNSNVEEYLSQLLESKKIKTPIFLIWVEPYLSAGHCLFLYPNSSPYSHFFDSSNLFKYNIISNSDYLANKEILSIDEAGCNTTFTPYSQSSITIFLSTIFPSLKKIIETRPQFSQSFSWIGDLTFLKENGVNVNDYYSDVVFNDLIVHDV
jgi:ThiF family.